MTLNTLPSLRTYRRRDNETELANKTQELVVDDSEGDNEYLSIVEAACVCWMAMEYVVRMWASPNRCVLTANIQAGPKK